MESLTNARFRSFSSTQSAITRKTVMRRMFAKASCVTRGDHFRLVIIMLVLGLSISSCRIKHHVYLK